MTYFISGLVLLLIGYFLGSVIDLRGADTLVIAAGWVLTVVGFVSLVLARAK